MDKWYLNRLNIAGILLIIAGILVYKVNFLHGVATSLFYPLLLGSSEGKAIIFLVTVGSLLILNSLIFSGKRLAFIDTSNSKKYLKYAIIIVLFTYIVAIITEIWLRLRFGVSIFTVFVSLNPDVGSTSIIHTHVFKSTLGYIFSIMGGAAPSNIHTGDSLFRYLSPLTYIILITLPLTYILSLISMDHLRDLYKVAIAFGAPLAMIGMVDGGIFSNPAIIGLSALMGMYFIKEPFSPRNLVKPVIIMFLIVTVGLFLEVGGSNPDYHQITVIHQTEPINWNGYDVLNTTTENNRTIIEIKPTKNDRETLVNLFPTFKGKADGFFITWNFYSYF